MSGIAGATQSNANAPGIWNTAKESAVQRSNAETNRTEQKQNNAMLRGYAESHTDLYVHGKEPESFGLYQVAKDETGHLKIIYDEPSQKATKATEAEEKAESTEDTKALAQASEEEETPQENAAADKDDHTDEDEKKKGDGVTITQVTGNCDKVEAEIKKLKQEKAALSQQIQHCADDSDKRKEMQHRLQQVESELHIKDTDTYRNQHSVITSQRVLKRPNA